MARHAAPPPDASRGRAVSDMPELKTLPPAIAASLARLAGVPLGSKPVTPAAPPARKRQDAGE